MANKIVVGVRTQGLLPSVVSELRSLNIPATAFEVLVTPAMRGRQYLSHNRPVIGGLDIKEFGATNHNCTLGFNTLTQGASGSPAFITNSHCSGKTWQYDASPPSLFTQGGPQIGFEIADPSPFYGSWSFNGRSGSCLSWMLIKCRFSDASLVAYDDTVPQKTGYLARTSGYGVGGPGPGGLLVGEWNIVNKFPISFLIVGRNLNKVGGKTAWTRGQVTQSCGDHFLYGIKLLCQYTTTIYSEDGDSGSPIFYDTDTGDPMQITSIHLAGLLWGGPPDDFNVTVFSPLSGIERDFGMTFKVCDALNAC